MLHAVSHVMPNPSRVGRSARTTKQARHALALWDCGSDIEGSNVEVVKMKWLLSRILTSTSTLDTHNAPSSPFTTATSLPPLKMSNINHNSHQYLQDCIQSAEKGVKNFRLGAVLVKDGKILSAGYDHQRPCYEGPGHSMRPEIV
jgi:hypothetical protein